MRQICFNLLGNAIKFTQSGGVRLVLRYAREMAHLEIHDTGPGMSAQELDRIFEPFTRGASAATGVAATGGSGLGLTIAKMLTDLMGGELSVSSTVGVGSVFQVRLFLPELHLPGAASAGVLERVASKPRTGYAGARRRILVVDNEEADRDLLVTLLQPLGFEMRTASNGYDGLDLLAAGLQPDVVLLDLAMPGIDGWETLRRIRALQGSQPQVAIVSANAFDRALDNGLGIAPEDFILKPVRHSELLQWLERRLELVWLDTAAPPPGDQAHTLVERTLSPPPRDALLALQDLVRLGFFRGVMNQIDALGAAHPESAAWLAGMATLARQYQFETMLTQLQKVLDEHPTS